MLNLVTVVADVKTIIADTEVDRATRVKLHKLAKIAIAKRDTPSLEDLVEAIEQHRKEQALTLQDIEPSLIGTLAWLIIGIFVLGVAVIAVVKYANISVQPTPPPTALIEMGNKYLLDDNFTVTTQLPKETLESEDTVVLPSVEPSVVPVSSKGKLILSSVESIELTTAVSNYKKINMKDSASFTSFLSKAKRDPKSKFKVVKGVTGIALLY